MIRIFAYEDRAAEPFAFETMFADRKEQFVDLLGWELEVVDDRFEIDAFDRDGARYIVALDDEGRHQGSLRLLPTDRPHLLESVFGWTCPLGVPAGPRVFEVTRLCLPARLDARQRLEIRNALISVMVDVALANGMSRLTGLSSERFRKDILAMGWLAEPLGPAVRIGATKIGAFALHIHPDTPERLGWADIYRADASSLVVPSATARQRPAADLEEQLP